MAWSSAAIWSDGNVLLGETCCDDSGELLVELSGEVVIERDTM